jgi:hypothetical protein
MKLVRACALLSFGIGAVVLTGSGCSSTYAEPDCPPGTEFSVDNRDRDHPEIDRDWLCFKFIREDAPPEVEPFVPPDVSIVSPPDPAGPKDPDGVVNAAIAYRSCMAVTTNGDVNLLVNRLYFTKPYWPEFAALADRTSCFKDMANGCETYRKCMGFARTDEEPIERPVPCKDGIAYWQSTDTTGYPSYKWLNCAGLGLTCEVNLAATGFGHCEYPNARDCDIKQEPGRECVDGDFKACNYEPGRPTDGVMFDLPRCSDYGLTCTAELGSYLTYCRGTGPDCSYSKLNFYQGIFDYTEGIQCQSDTLMRVCVGGGETVVDCSALGKDLKCIQTPGLNLAHCGYAEECDEYDHVLCEGTSLVVCDAGRIRKVDCKALGFNSCNAGYGFCE